MLTFESLRRILAEEKANQHRLAALPDNFWSDVRAYMAAKSAVCDKESEWEIESARNILRDIIEAREAKLLRLAAFYVRSGVSPEHITEHELTFFDSLVAVLREWQAAQQRILQQPELSVIILQDVAQFVDETRTYGPFAPGDMASLPPEIARLLIERGVAKISEER